MAVLTLSRSAVFQCAHHLPKMPDGHKCRRVHGHTFKVTITCRGTIVGDDGLVFDNARIDEILQVIVATIDHRNLNDMKTAFADNPTAERLVAWIWDLAANVPVVGQALWRVELEEGDRSVFAVQREEGELAAHVTALMRQALRNDPAPETGES
jgi:6-pyruvoyltetrahydropterin/6-carboxytetrahydropterin synthase